MLHRKRIKQLLRRLPLPPGEGVPAGASDADIDGFEERTGVQVPSELRAWLRISNGPFVGSRATFGIATRSEHLDIESCYDFVPEWQELGWMPIGTDGSGNYYVVPTRQEYGSGFPVLFVDTGSNEPDVPTYIVASSVGDFLEFLMESELGLSGWPFDKEEVLSRDPYITSFQDVDLPWEESA